MAPRPRVFTVPGQFGDAMLVVVFKDGATEYRGTIQAVSRAVRVAVPEDRPLVVELRNGLTGVRLAGPREIVVPSGASDAPLPLTF